MAFLRNTSSWSLSEMAFDKRVTVSREWGRCLHGGVVGAPENGLGSGECDVVDGDRVVLEGAVNLAAQMEARVLR